MRFFMSDSQEKIVFAQGNNERSFYADSHYAYLYTDDLFGHRTAVAQEASSSINSVLNKYLTDLVNPFVSVKSSINIDTGLLPPGVRYIGKNYVVFERPPTYQNVFYVPQRVEDMHGDGSEDSDSDYYDEDFNPLDHQITYRLPLPWQLYIATFDDSYLCASVHMYFMNTSLFSTDQIMGAPTIPNFFSNALLCRPMFDTMIEIDRYDKNIKGVIESAYDWVWNNGTNNDLNETIVQLFVQQPNHPIIANISEDRRRYFLNNTSHYFEAGKVQTFLSSWESLSIPDILDSVWPNPSTGTHFSLSPTSSPLPDNYSELLHDWLTDVFTEDGIASYDADDISDMIDNDDYSQQDFMDHLLASNLITPPVYEWHTTHSYKDVLNRIISTIPYGSKSASLRHDISRISREIVSSNETSSTTSS